jgi:hypothetical protein
MDNQTLPHETEQMKYTSLIHLLETPRTAEEAS